MPALMRAYQLSERTARCGFNRKNRQNLLSELEAEFDKLKRAIEIDDTDQFAKDFGSYLFSLVNLARRLNIHPETALCKAVKTFEQRFREMAREDSST